MMTKAPKSAPIALRVELLEISPLVWRRIVISNQWTLAAMHNYLQWLFGWQDTHEHEFRGGINCVAANRWIYEVKRDRPEGDMLDEKRVSVAVVKRELGTGGSFEYLYEMGDGWTHRIVIEDAPMEWVNLELRTPSCTAGENACPP